MATTTLAAATEEVLHTECDNNRLVGKSEAGKFEFPIIYCWPGSPGNSGMRNGFGPDSTDQ